MFAMGYSPVLLKQYQTLCTIATVYTASITGHHTTINSPAVWSTASLPQPLGDYVPHNGNYVLKHTCGVRCRPRWILKARHKTKIRLPQIKHNSRNRWWSAQGRCSLEPAVVGGGAGAAWRHWLLWRAVGGHWITPWNLKPKLAFKSGSLWGCLLATWLCLQREDSMKDCLQQQGASKPRGTLWSPAPRNHPYQQFSPSL